MVEMVSMKQSFHSSLRRSGTLKCRIEHEGVGKNPLPIDTPCVRVLSDRVTHHHHNCIPLQQCLAETLPRHPLPFIQTAVLVRCDLYHGYLA